MRAAVFLIGTSVVAGLVLLGPSLRSRAEPSPGTPPPTAAEASATDQASSESESESSTVTISISVVPSAKATVSWGRKRLGIIKPRSVLVVERPRDSGPLDLMIRADGYLPVQTRAYTFGDGKLAVRLTPVDQKSMLLGYREELPEAGLEGGLFGMGDSDAGTSYYWDAGATSSPDAGVRY